MGVAARKLTTAADLGGKWITVEEAAALTGLSQCQWIRRCQGEAHAAFVSARDSRAVKRVPPEGGKPVWHLHKAMDPILREISATDGKDERDSRTLREKYPEHAVVLALRRLHWLREWRDRYERRRMGETERSIAAEVVQEAKRREAAGFKIAVSTLQLWQRRHRSEGLEGLIDGRTPRAGDETSERSQEAIDYFYQCFRVELKTSIVQCHDMTIREARKRGWQWAESYRATCYWLKAHDHVVFSILMRKGQTEYAHRALPHVQRTYKNLEPGELFVSDHHQLDAFVLDGKRQVRPFFTAVQDARTRCIVGWNLDATPSSDTIIRALRMAFRDWAIPKRLKIDNGRDFGSKVITGSTKKQRTAQRAAEDHPLQSDQRFLGVTGELGIDVQYCIPFAPWGKGPTERAFGTFTNQCAKQFPTYCGNNPANKPESLAEIRQGDGVPTLEEARTIIGQWLDVYHRTEHVFEHEKEVPLATWNRATSLRRAVEKELDFLMDSRGVFKVGANGVGFMAAGTHWTYGANSPILKRYVGREVFITQDPDDLSCCLAWTVEREKRVFIARLQSNVVIPEGTNTEDARAVIAQKKREQSVMGKAARSSSRRTMTVAQRLREHTREKRSELLATGTDGKTSETCSIVPVRTGFEGASMPVQKHSHIDFAPLPSIESYDEYGDDEFSDPPPPSDLRDDDFDLSEFGIEPEEPGPDRYPAYDITDLLVNETND